MGYSGLITQQITTPNKGPRTVRKVDKIILHHWAGTDFPGTLRMWATAARKASCNYAIGNEGQRVGVVPEELRSWSVSNANMDSSAITFEIENESVNGWTISDAAFESTAQIMADLSRRFGIPLDRNHVIGHREVYTRFRVGYATACPGGLFPRMDELINRARQIAGNPALAPAAVPTENRPTVPNYPTGNYAGYKIKDIQGIVGADIDGVYGPDTTRKVREWQERVGGLVVDGFWGPASQAKANSLGGGATSRKIEEDGVWGAATTRALQHALAVEEDGVLGPQTYRALQIRTGLTGRDVDGIVGKQTRSQLQRYLGVDADGIWGRQTALALQRRLNAGTF
jgi:peptidoglycan hydrolase-like protein with peptidoglycan-binding domain